MTVLWVQAAACTLFFFARPATYRGCWSGAAAQNEGSEVGMKTGRPSTGCYHKTSRQLVYQYRHALKGLCVLCPQTVEGTSCYCAKHKRQVNEAQRKRYHAKKAKSEVRS